MKLSTIGALLRGDIANAVLSETPGGIEAQEAAGQRSFVANAHLPLDMRGDRAVFEAMGIVFGEPVDELFIEAKLPDGWRKEAIGHSMWSHLLDERGRKRAGIFYKAAFYDRSAHMYPERRFWCGRTYEGEIFARVSDYTGIIWRGDTIGPEPEWSREDNSAWTNWSSRRDTEVAVAKRWLDENYPDWCNPLAYWDID